MADNWTSHGTPKGEKAQCDWCITSASDDV